MDIQKALDGPSLQVVIWTSLVETWTDTHHGRRAWRKHQAVVREPPQKPRLHLDKQSWTAGTHFEGHLQAVKRKTGDGNSVGTLQEQAYFGRRQRPSDTCSGGLLSMNMA